MTGETRAGNNRILIGTGVLLLIVLAFALIAPYLDLEYLESQRSEYQDFYNSNPTRVILLYFFIVTGCVSLALPVTGASALVAGALFGLPTGLLICSMASISGATFVFLWSRYLFRDWLQARFSRQFEVVNRGVEKEGGYYLFSIRLLAIFPFFLVNILCGLTRLGLRTYVICTMAANTIVLAVLVYAGSILASLHSPSEILNPAMFASLALIGLAPLVLHRIILLVYRYRAGEG